MPLRKLGRRREENDPEVRIPALYIYPAFEEMRPDIASAEIRAPGSLFGSGGFFILQQLQAFTAKLEETDDEK